MKNLPTQTRNRGERPNNLKRDLRDPKRRKAPFIKKMQAIYKKCLYFLPQKRYKQYNKKNSIVHGGSKSNAQKHSLVVRYR